MAARGVQQTLSMVSERQQLGLSGHWPYLVAVAAMSRAAVVEMAG